MATKKRDLKKKNGANGPTGVQWCLKKWRGEKTRVRKEKETQCQKRPGEDLNVHHTMITFTDSSRFLGRK